MSKINVLMIIGQYYPLIGGAEKQCRLQAEELVRRGHRVRVVTGNWRHVRMEAGNWPKSSCREILNGVEVVRIIPWPSLFGIKKGVHLFFCLQLFIYLLFSLHKFDIVHMHQGLRPAVFTLLALKFIKKPSLIKIANSGIRNDFKVMKDGRGREHSLDRIFRLFRILEKADMFVCLNSQIYKELTEEGIPGKKLILIPNGVKASGIEKKDRYDFDGIFQLIYVGRLVKHKGIDILLDVFGELKGVSLDIYGKTVEISWQRKIEDKNLQNKINLKGMVSNLPKLLCDYDAFILPSFVEGMNNSLLEAFSCGLPCITTNISGNREVVSSSQDVKNIPIGEFSVEENGVLVNKEDVKGLREAINYLRRDKDTRENLGRSGRLRIEKYFSIASVADKYCTLYKKLISDKDYENS